MDHIQTPEEWLDDLQKEYEGVLRYTSGRERADLAWKLMVKEHLEADRAAIRAPLIEALEDIVHEWDILPSALPVRIEDVTEWLNKYMEHQINKARAALSSFKEE